MGELLADREILLEKTYQGKFYRIKTDSGELIEDIKAFEITMLKELGKLTL